MQARSNPVKPADLGVNGREGFLSRLARFGADPNTFEYRCVRRLDDGVPTVIEVAFAFAPRLGRRQLCAGVNWSPAISKDARSHAIGDGAVPRRLARHFSC